MLGSGRVHAALDPVGLDQVFTFWSTVSPRTVFEGVLELPPGHWLQATAEGITVQRYWQMAFAETEVTEVNPDERTVRRRAEELRELLLDAVRVRLRADVPVAAYLSGGLDSAVIAALARQVAPGRLCTFSIGFDDPQHDESDHQRCMAEFLGTSHEALRATHEEIGRVFPDVVWHCEAPLLRTAPAPMHLLSARLQHRGFKVALTGEGADEMLAGYDVFKEAKIRRFWGRQPASARRGRLLQRLYAEIAGLHQAGPELLGAFFRQGLTDLTSPYYSHLIRWRNGGRHRRFFSPSLLHALPAFVGYPSPEFNLPAAFANWGPLERAQYLEIALFLSNYLLSAQGDRMAMAHAVEGRFPFLDYRVVEFCAQLPTRLKLRVLQEKYLLRQVAKPLLPPEICSRRKHPYRAPIHRAFFHPHPEPYVHELLEAAALRATGLFRPEAVGQLVAKLENGAGVGEGDDMALAGILSSQLLHDQFIARFRMPAPLTSRDDVMICVLGANKTADRCFGVSVFPCFGGLMPPCSGNRNAEAPKHRTTGAGSVVPLRGDDGNGCTPHENSPAAVQS